MKSHEVQEVLMKYDNKKKNFEVVKNFYQKLETDRSDRRLVERRHFLNKVQKLIDGGKM